MGGRRHRQLVRDINADLIPFDSLDNRSRRASVISPALGFEARGKFVEDGLGDQMKDLDSIYDPEGEGGTIRHHHGRVVFARHTRREVIVRIDGPRVPVVASRCGITFARRRRARLRFFHRLALMGSAHVVTLVKVRLCQSFTAGEGGSGDRCTRARQCLSTCDLHQ